VTAYRSFKDIPPLAYDLIMADPPWSFDNYSAKGEAKNAKAHYRCAGVDDIADVPVSSFASKDCLLWLWATNPMLPQAIDLMARWGFTFVTAGHWSKKTASGKQAFGTGYVLRSAGEPFLIGKIGRPVTTRGVRSVIEGVAREHSRKPEEAYAAAEALIPDARRLDLYSRQERSGWDCAGDEVGKFAGEAA
jgi:N6-adenosine-specific RNA methylase IME4